MPPWWKVNKRLATTAPSTQMPTRGRNAPLVHLSTTSFHRPALWLIPVYLLSPRPATPLKTQKAPALPAPQKYQFERINKTYYPATGAILLQKPRAPAPSPNQTGALGTIYRAFRLVVFKTNGYSIRCQKEKTGQVSKENTMSREYYGDYLNWLIRERIKYGGSTWLNDAIMRTVQILRNPIPLYNQ